MIHSRNKGAAGERELAAVFRAAGYPDARRGQQHAGGPDSPDVVGGPPGIHWECKRVESGNPYVWHDQAVRDSEGKAVPIVAHRRSNRPWIAILTLDALLALLAKGQPPPEACSKDVDWLG